MSRGLAIHSCSHSDVHIDYKSVTVGFCAVTQYPVYEKLPPKYSAERILQILLDPAISPCRVRHKRPVSISSSATYVIDISKLADPKDVKNDNFGSWNHSGSHPST